MEENHHVFERKENIRYILCEHLENKIQNNESYNQWIGENTRLISCPVCLRVFIGGMISLLNKYPSDYVSKFIEPQEDDYILAPLFWKK